jgi:hypothetical protein
MIGLEVYLAEAGVMSRERKHPIAEDCRQIAVRQVPAPGERTCLRWVDGASATLERQGEVARIGYRWPGSDGWHVTMQTLRLVAYRPQLGGTRFYFACPDCGRWARKLFDATGGRFLCRHCGGLANRCQSEGAWARALRRAAKLRRYCGGSGDVSAPFPERPKHMRRCVYEALRAEAGQLESLPESAWLSDGRDVALGVRRGTMGASKRRWWPARNAEC